MHINNLSIDRFRGIHSLSLDFDITEKMTIFPGRNGTCKTAVLDSAAILLSWFVNRIRREGSSGAGIKEVDIKKGESSAFIEITLSHGARSFFWNVSKARKGRNRKNVHSWLKRSSDAARYFQYKISGGGGVVNLPVVAYYPANRVLPPTLPLNASSLNLLDSLRLYDNSTFIYTDFSGFFQWFRAREDFENEKLSRDPASSTDVQLEAVRSALAQFMPDFKGWAVRRNPLRIDVEKKGERLTFNQLSNGEKFLMATVGDMARRMAMANPLRDNPFDGDGIILIDEVELHLHHSMHESVVSNLKNVFPNIQFLVSTNSLQLTEISRKEMVSV